MWEMANLTADDYSFRSNALENSPDVGNEKNGIFTPM